MEADLRIILTEQDFRSLKSISVFVDDTMNKEVDFFEPIIRVADWNRRADALGSNSWPSVNISLSRVENKGRLDTLIRQLQGATQTLHFGVLGLSRARDAADVPSDRSRPNFEVFLCNGVQSWTFYSSPLTGDAFTDLVFDTFAALEALRVPIALEGWEERYDLDLSSPQYPGQPWDWPYHAPGPGKVK